MFAAPTANADLDCGGPRTDIHDSATIVEPATSLCYCTGTRRTRIQLAFRLACRALLRSRWYAITAIGTIVLTIVLGTTVFAVVDGVRFKPLPYPSSHRLFSLRGSAGSREGTASLAALDVKYLRVAFAGAALLILLGAINVAGLFGARARDRGRELSIRAALGAGWGHLAAVLLAEAAVIALVGGLLGVLVASPLLTATIALLITGA